MSSLPWPDGEFGAIMAVNSAQFWPDPAADLAEALRVLGPGGRIVIALRAGTRHGHADLADRYAFLLADHHVTVARHHANMRTGPAVFLAGHQRGQ